MAGASIEKVEGKQAQETKKDHLEASKMAKEQGELSLACSFKQKSATVSRKTPLTNKIEQIGRMASL